MNNIKPSIDFKWRRQVEMEVSNTGGLHSERSYHEYVYRTTEEESA